MADITQEQLDEAVAKARADATKESKAATLRALGFDSMSAAESGLTELRAAAETAKGLPALQERNAAHEARFKRIAERELAALPEAAQAAVKARGESPEATLDAVELFRAAGFLAAPAAKPAETTQAADTQGEGVKPTDAQAKPAGASPIPASTSAGANPPAPDAKPPTAYEQWKATEEKHGGLAASVFYAQNKGAILSSTPAEQ